MKDHKKGFTLVELSIVLVIIGLLIGGILVGQSLIDSAKMQSFVRQMQQYDAAVAQFKSKFRQLPGDASVFGCTTTGTNTCNNGVIETALGGGGEVFFFQEVASFWEHLSNSGFKPNNESYLPDIATSEVITGYNVPEAAIGDGAGVSAYQNSYYVGAYTNDNYVDTTPGLSAIDALAFDAKVDDGIANTGDVVDSGLTTCDVTTGSPDPSQYDIEKGSEAACTLIVQMLSGTNF